MPRLTKSQYEAELAMTEQRGFQRGREAQKQLMIEDMRKLKEDVRLKILSGIGQCFQANATATEALARFVDNYNMNS